MAHFSSLVNFKFAAFGEPVYFIGAYFDDHIFFSSAHFDDSINFSGAYIVGSAYFDEVYFDGPAYFGWITFDDSVDFHNATFDSSADFWMADFYDSVTFSNVDFKDSANFRGVSFNDSAFFVAPYSPDNIVPDGQNIEIFMRFYKSQGLYGSADIAYYNYRKECQANKEWYETSKWTDLIVWFVCGYGVRPLHTLNSGGFIVLLFAIIYAKGPVISLAKLGNNKISPRFYWQGPGISRLKEEDRNKSQKVSFKDALYFSMTTFTTVGYGDWYPKDNFRKWATLEGLLGWIMLGIFMATLTNVIIRA